MTDSATTTLGTPASPNWDADWLAEVERKEHLLGHRICGAHTPAWTPCTLASAHPNGRCRFHGGAPGIGAPQGNRNAWVHGLYSRRLQQCGDHCPLWKHCPMAGPDVLNLRPAERPHCVYEQDEYDQVLNGLHESTAPCDEKPTATNPAPSSFPRRRGSPVTNAAQPSQATDGKPTPNESAPALLRASPPPREANLVERNVALFQVLLSRAQAALRISSLTDEYTAQSDTYTTRSVRVSAILQAQLHIARELRQWLKLLPGFDPRTKPKPNEDPPERPMGLPDLMKPILEEAEVVFDELLGPGGFPGRGLKRAATDRPPAPG